MSPGARPTTTTGGAVPALPVRRGLLLRMLPPGLYAGRPGAVVERSLLVYRRAWLIIISGFVEPLLYLLSFGRGLSSLVGDQAGPDGRTLSYAAFIAPALLASSAMNGAVFDSTINVFFKLKFAKLYDGMLATSMGPLDLAMGEIGWALGRGALYAGGFFLVMLVLGTVSSWWAVLLVPAAVLVGFGFAAVGMAATTFFNQWQDLELVALVTLPMFLFSGTFYSLSVYPWWGRILVECLPLHHAVVIMRALTYGDVGPGLLLHAAYFVVMAAVGTVVATRRLTALLLS